MVNGKAGTAVVSTRKYCGASTRAARQGRPKGSGCRHPAGFRTDHLGEGRCWMHGGATLVKHGRYSKIKRDRVRELIEQHEADPDPLNILPELAAARAIFEDFVTRYDEWRGALIAWHASYSEGYKEAHAKWLQARGDQCAACSGKGYTGDAGEEPDPALYVEKPRQILDQADAYRIVSEVTKIVERIETIDARNAISRADFSRLVNLMWADVEREIPEDRERLTRIRTAWLANVA